MKVKPFTRRSASNPTEGIAFAATEIETIETMAESLTGLDSRAIETIRAALGEYSKMLEAAGDWTEPNSANEEFRMSRYTYAMMLHEACNGGRLARAMARISK
jgi:hypothetical protein